MATYGQGKKPIPKKKAPTAYQVEQALAARKKSRNRALRSRYYANPAVPMNTKVDVALVIGKFYPPHKGHVELITQAAVKHRYVKVLICSKKDQVISGTTRAQILKYTVPANVTFDFAEDNLPAENRPWAEHINARYGKDYFRSVYTSEDWGDEFAEMINAKHVNVGRVKYPTSATEIKEDVNGNFHLLADGLQERLFINVIMVGAESSGKTSLARALAHKYRTLYVPEYGRYYTEAVPPEKLEHRDFDLIASEQAQMVHRTKRHVTNGILFQDTDVHQTVAWHKRYLTNMDLPMNMLDSYRQKNTTIYNLWVVCDHDFPWVQDGTRESKTQQNGMKALIQVLLDQTDSPHIVANGPKMKRIHDVSVAINRLLAARQKLRC